MKNILVTGIGGDIGLGVGRILKSAQVASKIVGCDIHDDHPGSMIFDACEVVKKASGPEYFTSMKQVIKRHGIDLIIPTVEPEMRFFAQEGIFETLLGVPIIMANSKAVNTGFDKLQTAEFLRTSGLPYPWTLPVNTGPPPSLPCIIKDRFGAGSVDVCLVDKELVLSFMSSRPSHIWQEYLAQDDDEFTCGIYRSACNDIRHIAFRRRLKGGVTQSGEVVNNQIINQLLVNVAEALELRGSINVQLRLCERGPVVFEINPRFSSTVVFRHLLGFQDLIWSLQEKSGEMLSTYNPPSEGTKIYRGSKEYII
jgi:carbamoyl-phosphate synthase large subunit